MKFLVVDDSSTMRKIVVMTLKMASHDAVEAENGQDALSKLTEKFDAMIVDVNMPVMNGIDFVKAARATAGYAVTPIIMLTTESEQDMVNQGKAAGANAWMVKPFKNEELLATISALVK